MAKYLTLLLIIFLGCEMNGKQIIKNEKLNFDEIKFDAVSKHLTFENKANNNEVSDMQKIITYWFDNKIKTDGFEGSLEVIIDNLNTNKIKNKDYFKFTIDITFTFIEEKNNPKKRKIYKINTSEHGEISGSFSINDQENLILNTMYKSLESVSKKILELNN